MARGTPVGNRLLYLIPQPRYCLSLHLFSSPVVSLFKSKQKPKAFFFNGLSFLSLTLFKYLYLSLLRSRNATMSATPPPSSSALNNNNIRSIPNLIINNQRPALLPDHPSHNASSSFGKRTISDFQAHHFHQQHPLFLQQQGNGNENGNGIGIGYGAFSMRSVKPRIYQNPSPNIDMLLPHINNNNSYIRRYAHTRPIRFGTDSVVPTPNNPLSYNHNFINPVLPRKSTPADSSTGTDNNIIMNRLQELEK